MKKLNSLGEYPLDDDGVIQSPDDESYNEWAVLFPMSVWVISTIIPFLPYFLAAFGKCSPAMQKNALKMLKIANDQQANDIEKVMAVDTFEEILFSPKKSGKKRKKNFIAGIEWTKTDLDKIRKLKPDLAIELCEYAAKPSGFGIELTIRDADDLMKLAGLA